MFVFGRARNEYPVLGLSGTSDQGVLEGIRLFSGNDELNIVVIKEVFYRQIIG